ncbi:AAA family ATPase [Acidimicrobiaceae bacterium USS-CC1]|uniref:AAA family ATPase n=1 Tax=Acidiferrimicrobium australe TaxID=2664430 RepID=A0ABW9QRK5_9ACTN|nr:AAA family ATPase [Acidiferrimicrobium australe]
MTRWAPPPLTPRLATWRHLPLVGRRRELQTVEEVWGEVLQGRRQVLLVGGEPGAGKTRLAAEVAGALHDDDVAVLVGSCSADAGVPYQPFAEMLDQLFGTTPPGALAPFLDEGARELRRLTAGVARHRPDLAEVGAGGGELRRDLFDAVARLLTSLSADRPLAVVLDDVHWAQAPTLALLEHVLQACTATRLLVLATFRTTAPDRSEELAARLADLHRLEGVRRLDLGGLDTEAIAEFVSLRSGLPLHEARPAAALLRDRTGGNPFFLRELWGELQRHGGVAALRSPGQVPASIGDALAARLAGLEHHVRSVIELAAVLGDTFGLATLVAAGEVDRDRTMAGVDSACDLGLIELIDPGSSRYSFIHSLTRQAVTDRMPHARRMVLNARAAQALERLPPDPAVVPRLARHYLAAHLLGFHEPALRYSQEAGLLAERSLAFEDAAAWFERAASLPGCEPAVRARILLSAAADYVRACNFPQARVIYEQLSASGEPLVGLRAAIGFEDATWRPGLVGGRAADLLASALDDCGLDEDDPRYVQALSSYGRALALAGETERSRQIGGHALALARRLGDEPTLVHALTTSLWHGTTPDVAPVQHERAIEVQRLARGRRDHESLGAAVNFGATVSYLLGLPDELEEAVGDSFRVAQATGQPYYRHVHHCLAHSRAFVRGDFEGAQTWTDRTVEEAFGDEMTEGPHAVQTFMVRRETGGLAQFRPFLDGREPFAGRWVPGLLALYTELELEAGIRRALQHLLSRDLRARRVEAPWPMELVFMVEGALALGDKAAAQALQPMLAEYEGMNVVCGTLIATFGSADRFLARVAHLLGEPSAAERHFGVALAMDRHMRSTVHEAETLAHQARFAAEAGRRAAAAELASQARALAGPSGQVRVLRLVEDLATEPGPDCLTGREVDVLRLLAAGCSNQEIGARLHISANTAANHVRSILTKTGAANRTQAAVYAAARHLA